MSADNLALARTLDAQHPDRWYSGQWYPATGPNDTAVEIMRTNGKGANAHQRYLHVRRPARRVLRHYGSDEVTDLGPGFIVFRFNLQTGEAKEL
jgi:hypothetical protein